MKISIASAALCWAMTATIMTAGAAIERRADRIILSEKRYSVSFSLHNGSVVSVEQTDRTGSIWKSGENGLWHARRRDGSVLKAADFSDSSTQSTFTPQIDAKNKALRLNYRSAEIDVTVNIWSRADGLEMRGVVQPKSGTVLDFALPSRLRFETSNLERFIAPANGHEGVGFAFKRTFFQKQPNDNPTSWKPENPSPAAYQEIFGGPLAQRPDADPPVGISITEQGRTWLGEPLAARIQSTLAIVNRPPAPGQADIVLIDSPNGPYFSGSRLGRENGALWRIGGSVRAAESTLMADVVATTIGKVLEKNSRPKIGLLALKRGPARADYAAIGISTWRARLGQLTDVHAHRVQLVEIENADALHRALQDNSFATIVNPYGEWLPAWEKADQVEVARAIKAWVQDGGHWFENGGYSFYSALRPQLFASRTATYPPLFADFLYLQSRNGQSSIFGVQPRKHAPWTAANNRAAMFVPGTVGYGGDAGGGFCDRAFATYVSVGERWESPRVRMTIGANVTQALGSYAQQNNFSRRLQDKMSATSLARFKNAVLVKVDGSAREKIESLKYLPIPTQIHFSDYLKGGFDKEYPDHLPPNAAFGTPSEMKRFFDEAHRLGHLVVPYTNPTWWCDHPRGPTFLQAGEAPLVRDLDSKLAYERYTVADGWTSTFWHPAVRAANRKVRAQFTRDYPVDVLFQDQIGARSWKYDTNPASPTPYAYIEGLLSQAQEDAGLKPLSTENGWDQLINYEAQFCGLSFGTVPSENAPEWLQLLRDEIPPDQWEIFPLAQYLAHDKVAFLHHDLGQFVTNRETLAWTLALGYNMSYRSSAASLGKDAPRAWLQWLDRVQKSIGARALGQPVTQWKHERGTNTKGDGIITAKYGPVSIAANLEAQPRLIANRTLPPFGFRAHAPGMVAANWLPSGSSSGEGTSFVTEQNTLKGMTLKGATAQYQAWIYAPSTTRTAIEIPAAADGWAQVSFEGGVLQKVAVRKGVLSLKTPVCADTRRVVPPVAWANKAPREWLQNKTIGIVNLGLEVGWSWTSITPEQWKQAFDQSRLVRELGFQIHYLTSYHEVEAALRGGPQKYFAIVNAHTEKFPVRGAGAWKATLDAIRTYVENGGQWWETGGHSFYAPTWQEDGVWKSEAVGPSGAAYLGLPIGGGAVDEAAQSLRAVPQNSAWLGAQLSAKINSSTSVANRFLSRGSDDPGHLALVAGEAGDFIGGYRFSGWGYLWRIGGFNPNPQVALPVVMAATEYAFMHAPQATPVSDTKYLWHANISLPQIRSTSAR